ncbi:MAG TPA: hypothetical protein VMK65_02945 [Longimicrobiales bacterium]|nr:hypothetical protein [Longimicrobiales bacterium]
MTRVRPATPERTAPGADPATPGRRLRVLRGALLVAGALLVPPVVEATMGPWLREALLIDVRTSGVDSAPAFEDDPAESTAFFAARDTVAFTLEAPMSVGELLSLYHLATNEAARAALRVQHGVRGDDDVLPAGARIVLPLTPAPGDP